MPFIQVILPLRLSWEPYYRTSCEDVTVGMRAAVRFAGRRYVAVVSAVGVAPGVDASRILDIDSLERHLAPIAESELRLWRFIADYYLCSIGEVYKMAYPASKTTGEQISARTQERRELMDQKRRELLTKRLERLEERLEAKRKALEGRHGEKVRSALEASRDAILSEMEEVQKAIRTCPEGSNADTTANTGAHIHGNQSVGLSGQLADKRAVPAKPLLLSGGPQRLTRLLEAAGESLQSGRDVLWLVPDIRLSNALQDELQRRYPQALMAFNSTESATRKREIAGALRSGSKPLLVLGTRSAIFLPFRQLGLVIVEEEHDSFYKQDGAPRYNARDIAVVLGALFGAGVILSSPTPSLESLHNVISGRYTYASAEGSAFKEIEVVDTGVEARKHGMVGSLSRVLINKVSRTLGSGGKVLILRPWSPAEDLTAEVEALWPDHGGITLATTWQARRMDISSFSLIAIIGTDALLDRSDFRADEHLWQALGQLRSRSAGAMLIQTRQGSHPAYKYFSGEDPDAPDYARTLLAERKAFACPPYTRIVDITVRDSNGPRLRKLSMELAESLAGYAPLGPFAPAGAHKEDEKAPKESQLTLRITFTRDKELANRKRSLAQAVAAFETARKYTGHIGIDVDPA